MRSVFLSSVRFISIRTFTCKVSKFMTIVAAISVLVKGLRCNTGFSSSGAFVKLETSATIRITIIAIPIGASIMGWKSLVVVSGWRVKMMPAERRAGLAVSISLPSSDHWLEWRVTFVGVRARSIWTVTAIAFLSFSHHG